MILVLPVIAVVFKMSFSVASNTSVYGVVSDRSDTIYSYSVASDRSEIYLVFKVSSSDVVCFSRLS